MEVITNMLPEDDFPVRFLGFKETGEECPWLIFEFTRLVTIEEAVCLACRIAQAVAESRLFVTGFCLEILLQSD